MNNQYLHILLVLFIFSLFCNCDEKLKLLREKKINLIKKYMKKIKKQDGVIRLVNGRGDYEGNVEIYHLGKWGSICDDEWDKAEAEIVCRYLGYPSALRATHSSHFGSSRRRYWIDNMLCTGEEKQLTDCRFDGWGNNDCTESEAAGVVCGAPETVTTAAPPVSTKPPKTRIKDKVESLKVRLFGGRITGEGRVEVKLENTDWGVICGDGWSLLEASVVCRQLGYGYASDALQTDFFRGGGSNDTSMIVSGVECHGNEDNIEHCLHDEVHNVTCPGRKENHAAVVCTHKMADLVIDYEEIMRTTHLEDRQMYFLQCAMEENCLSSQAYQIQKDNTHDWHLETRRLLRFTARIVNVGTADFRPFVPKHLWEWHSCHMHYHSMEVFATFDVIDQHGRKVADGHKASFCLEDNQCISHVQPVYACANYGDQGISVNCSDIYRHNIDCQWVDITELEPGVYNFKVAINPEFKVGEQTFDNNAAFCTLHYTETYAVVNNCTLQRP